MTRLIGVPLRLVYFGYGQPFPLRVRGCRFRGARRCSGRGLDPDAMDLIKVEEVTARLDQFFGQ